MKKIFSSYWLQSAFFSFLQKFSLAFFGLINFMIIARVLSISEMGTWGLFLVITTIFETSKSGLIKNAQIKFISGSEDAAESVRISSSSLLINFSISVLFILLILTVGPGLSKQLNWGNDLAIMLQWFTPGILVMVFFSHFEAVQQSHFDFRGVFAGHIARQGSFFLLLAVHWIFNWQLSIKELAIYQAGSILAGTAIIYLFSKKHLHNSFVPSLLWIKKLTNFGRYLFGTNIISNVVSNLDQLMTASFFKSADPVAFYNTATRLNGFIDMPSYAASEILFPKMSQASALEGLERVKYLYEKMVSILLAIVIPAAGFVILFPKLIIGIIAGSQYEAAAPILQLYMLNSILGTLQNQSANTLNSMNKPGLCFILNCISLGLKLGLTYICLYHFGFYGAALGTVTTSFLGGIIWYLAMRKHLGIQLGNIFRNIPDFYKVVYQMIPLGKNKSH